MTVPSLGRLSRVLRQARHQIRGTERINVANHRFLQVSVTVERRLEYVGADAAFLQKL